jgi:hypothetical protein
VTTKLRIFVREVGETTWEEIEDLYWFEENGVHDFSGEGGTWGELKLEYRFEPSIDDLVEWKEKAIYYFPSLEDMTV